jgi:hypothetical protein
VRVDLTASSRVQVNSCLQHAAAGLTLCCNTVQVKVALYHKGLAFTKLLAKPCGGGGGLNPDFLARAPLGKIPALVVRSVAAAESEAAASSQPACTPAEVEEVSTILPARICAHMQHHDCARLLQCGGLFLFVDRCQQQQHCGILQPDLYACSLCCTSLKSSPDASNYHPPCCHIFMPTCVC